jgi:hypothetical protein
MAVSLALVAIERDHVLPMGCLLENHVREGAFEVRRDESVEPLLFIDLVATFYNLSADVVDIVNRSYH